MTPLLFDPRQIRRRTCDGLAHLGLAVRPDLLPRIFGPNDNVAVRPPSDLEARAAILNVVQARVFEMPPELAMRWLLDAHVLDDLTSAEWQFIATGNGDARRFSDQLESLYALAWMLGLTSHLDPSRYCSEQLPTLMPDLRAGEPFADWRGRALPAPREAVEVAEMLDLYCCLDWMCEEARRHGERPPARLDHSMIWHRRWSLEWSLVPAGSNRADTCPWDRVQM